MQLLSERHYTRLSFPSESEQKAIIGHPKRGKILPNQLSTTLRHDAYDLEPEKTITLISL